MQCAVPHVELPSGVICRLCLPSFCLRGFSHDCTNRVRIDTTFSNTGSSIRLIANRISCMTESTRQLLQQLEDVVGPAGILTGKALEGRSAGIWSGEDLQALALLRPKNTAEVSAVMKLCHTAGQVVVPAGGMTGLAGGHESTEADVVLSTERMNRVEKLDARARTMVVEAGVVLQTVQETAAQDSPTFHHTKQFWQRRENECGSL